MQALVLQFGRFGFLLLLWFFIWLTLHTLKNDTLAASKDTAASTKKDKKGKKRGLKGLFKRDKDNPNKAARYLMITQGPLSGARISLGTQPVLLGRADDSTLVLNDDYASGHHARFIPRGDDWYLEDLGSTNGTFLDHDRVTTAVKVPLGTPVRVGKTVIELRP
ncbi:MAG: FHA domain-containing protein [Lawsonella sp.]|nr:FHA domain-containing protein [Mycobacteriales bacterium]